MADMLPDPPDDKGGKQDPDPVAASLAKMQADIDGLQRATVARAAPQQSQQPSVPTAEDLRKEFFKDPVGMAAAVSNATSQQAVESLQRAVMPGLIQQARATVRNVDPEIFDKYEPEVLEKVNRTHPSNHGNPDVWKAAFDLVKGTHMDDVIAMKSKSKPGEAKGTDGPAAPSTKAPPAAKVAPLNDDESLFVKNFQITDDGFRRGKDIINGQSERGKSSWDSVITFDSKSRRRERAETARALAGKR